MEREGLLVFILAYDSKKMRWREKSIIMVVQRDRVPNAQIREI